MVRSVGAQRIAKHRIAGKPIAAPFGSANLQTPYQYPAGSYTFTAPITGYWKFVLWGPGAQGATSSGSPGGGSGAYLEITKRLAAQQTVALVVGLPGSATTATFPDGAVASAGAASGQTGGSASGGDVNLSGSSGGNGGLNAGAAGSGTGGGAGGAAATGEAGGAGAPANLPFRGGAGGRASGTADQSRGGDPGGGSGVLATPGAAAGAGAAIVFLVRE